MNNAPCPPYRLSKISLVSEKNPIKENLVSLESASLVHYRDIIPAGTHSGGFE